MSSVRNNSLEEVALFSMMFDAPTMEQINLASLSSQRLSMQLNNTDTWLSRLSPCEASRVGNHLSSTAAINIISVSGILFIAPLSGCPLTPHHSHRKRMFKWRKEPSTNAEYKSQHIVRTAAIVSTYIYNYCGIDVESRARKTNIFVMLYITLLLGF